MSLRRPTRCLVMLAVIGAFVCLAQDALGATFAVNRIDDRNLTCGARNGCSLREAINAANANGPALDTITFHIANSGAQTITLGATLPAISSAVTIDGR